MAFLGMLVLMPMSVQAQVPPGNPLANIPVTGNVQDGGSFKGHLTIAEFGLNASNQLVASGFLTGTVKGLNGAIPVRHAFTDQVISLSQGDGEGITIQQNGDNVCDILLLEIPGGLFIDLLGLTIDLSPITLDINAVQGPGNLLGNLLCLIVNLLNPSL